MTKFMFVGPCPSGPCSQCGGSGLLLRETTEAEEVMLAAIEVGHFVPCGGFRRDVTATGADFKRTDADPAGYGWFYVGAGQNS